MGVGAEDSEEVGTEVVEVEVTEVTGVTGVVIVEGVAEVGGGAIEWQRHRNGSKGARLQFI